MPSDKAIRAQNLWTSFARKIEPLGRGAQLEAEPAQSFENIGGLAAPKDELQTYACAATSPEVYERWGTGPPSGILLVGQRGAGKNLLARALATQTGTSFLNVDIPRLVIDVIHNGSKVPEMIPAWTQTLDEMPKLTIFFDELEFSMTQEIGARRNDLPIGPVMDFLMEIIDRAIATDDHLVLGATSHPDTLRQAFVVPGRFERIVEVAPSFPEDMVAAIQIHARDAEKRAGRPLFGEVDWDVVVHRSRAASPGDWVRILHAVLRRKARCEASGEEAGPVDTRDLKREVERFEHALQRIRAPEGGNYV